MHKLFILDNGRLAQAFVDYCDSRQLKVLLKAEPESHHISMWVVHDEQRLEIEAELKRFLSEPAHERYKAASWDMADTRTSSFRFSAPSLLNLVKQGAGPFTLLILMVCAGVYLFWGLGYQQPLFVSLHFPIDASQFGEVWRWVTHAFLHFSIVHIAFNCLWWWLLGGQIEKTLGSGILISLFVLSAALSGIGQYVVSGANFGGLSGVVYALMGYCWCIGKLSPDRGVSLPNAYATSMLVWLVICFIQPIVSIANTAHVIGLVVGCLIAWLDSLRPSKVKSA